MEKTLRKTVLQVSKESVFILFTVACAVILPQILHGAGVLLGMGGKLGQIFLPMYLPVLILGFYRGPLSGAATGTLAPLISFAITGMPQASLLPYITIELISLGFFAGMLSRTKLPALLRVLSAQVLAKLLRLAAYATALYTTSSTLSAPLLFAGIVTSLPGVLIQLVLVTYLIVAKEKKHHEA